MPFTMKCSLQAEAACCQSAARPVRDTTHSVAAEPARTIVSRGVYDRGRM